MIKRRVLVVYLHSSKCPFLPIESGGTYYYNDDDDTDGENADVDDGDDDGEIFNDER